MNKGFNKPESPSTRAGGPPGGGAAKEEERFGLPPSYLQSGYFDSKGNLIDKLITEWAKDIAEQLHRGKMKTTQLRKFFGEARRLDRKLEEGTDFDKVKAEILKLAPYAHDAVKKQKAPALFEEFMNRNLKWASQRKENFTEGFVNHFECVVAFFPEARD